MSAYFMYINTHNTVYVYKMVELVRMGKMARSSIPHFYFMGEEDEAHSLSYVFKFCGGNYRKTIKWGMSALHAQQLLDPYSD